MNYTDTTRFDITTNQKVDKKAKTLTKK